MMKYTISNLGKSLLITSVSFCSYSAIAQVSSGVSHTPGQTTTYLLPDGKVLAREKLDSLNKAWGRVILAHNEEDDTKGVIRLVRMTDDMKRKLEEGDAARKQAMASMLDQPAANFELRDLEGKLWSSKQLRGKIVVLNFWFTSCAPCIQEMPELNELMRVNEGKNVVFLALTYNDEEKVRAFLKKRAFHYTMLPNSGEVDKKFQISLWPTSVVIDKAGYVRMIANSSPKIREELESAINSLM